MLNSSTCRVRSRARQAFPNWSARTASRGAGPVRREPRSRRGRRAASVVGTDHSAPGRGEGVRVNVYVALLAVMTLALVVRPLARRLPPAAAAVTLASVVRARGGAGLGRWPRPADLRHGGAVRGSGVGGSLVGAGGGGGRPGPGSGWGDGRTAARARGGRSCARCGTAWVWCPGPVAAAVCDCGELLTVEELLNSN